MKSINNSEYYINSSFGNIEFYRSVQNTQSFRPHFHETYTTWSFLTFHIPVEIMRKVNQNESIIPLFRNNQIKDDHLFEEGFNLFLNLLAPGNFDDSEKKLMSFLQNLNNKHAKNNLDNKSNTNKKIIAKKIREHIHNSLNDELSLNHISKEFNLSVFSLIKIFKSSYDLPPHQYMVNLKIEKAKKMLLKDRSCTEVAYDAGFFDQSHFIRHFKKIVGVTPKKYMNMVG